MKKINADFQPWFGFSSSGQTDLIFARVNDTTAMDLGGLANAGSRPVGTFAAT